MLLRRASATGFAASEWREAVSLTSESGTQTLPRKRHARFASSTKYTCYHGAVPTSRHAIVLGLTVLLALEAKAAIVTLPIPSQEVRDLLQLADGRLAVSGLTEDQGFVHVIDPAGGARKDIEITVPGEGTVVPYRKGFVTWGRNAATFEVRYFEVGQISRESVLHSAEALDYLYLAAPPAGDSLYVAESLSRGGMRLIRFNSSGQLAWTRNYEQAPSGVTAVSDGVVFMQAIPGPPADRPRAVLTKLGMEGELAWSSPATYGVGGVPTVRFHSQKVIAVATAATDETIELANYDSGSGQQISHSTFPGFAKLVGTMDGLLLSHSYMYRPFIAMMDAAGSIRWWRRYTPAQSIGVPVSGAISRAGQLVLLTRNPDQSEEWPANKVVFMTADGKELSEGLNACTRRDPLPVMQDEKLLRARYAIDVAPDYGLMSPAGKSGCPHPTDDEYAAAVSAIADGFVNRAETKNPWAERVYVRIVASGPAMRLTSYYLGMAGSDSPQRQIGFEVRHDNARAFSKYVRETVFPHMSRIEEARNRFMELTGQIYGAHAPQGELPDPDEFFAEMERATQVLEQKVLAADSSHPWPRRVLVGAILYPTQFGSYGKMKRLEVADQTLRELIQKAAEERR